MSNGNICLGEHHIPKNPTDQEKCNGKEEIDDKNNKDILVVEVKGEKPTSGTIIIENGQIVNELNIDKYLDAVKEKLTSNGTYTIMKDGNICKGTLTNNTCTGTIIEIEVDIAKPSKGTVTINNGNVTISEASKENTQLVISEKEVSKNEENEFVIVGTQKEETIEVGKFNSVCKPAEGTKYNTTAGTKYKCKVKEEMEEEYKDGYTFYVLNATSTEVNLIMDQNINSDGTPAGMTGTTKNGDNVYNLVAWNSSAENPGGPVDAMQFYTMQQKIGLI